MNIDFKSVVYYFKFQSYYISNGKGGMNSEIQISGKIRKGNIEIFVLMLLFLVFLYSVGYKSIETTIIVSAIALISTAIIFLIHKIMFKTIEEKSDNEKIYERNLPSSLRPAHVRLLLNDGLIDEISIASTIIDLIDKGYLQIDSKETIEKLFRKDVNMTISKTGKDMSDLLEYEKFLINWFINECGDGVSVSSSRLHEMLNDREGTTSNDRYNNFKALVITSFPLEAFYTKHDSGTKKGIISLILIIIGMFAFKISPYLIFLPIIGYGMLLFLNPSYTLNKNGVEEIKSWHLFKKFLKDNSIISEKTSEMVETWNYYLTYSIVMDINQTAKNEIIDFFGKNIHVGNDAHVDENENHNMAKNNNMTLEMMMRKQAENNENIIRVINEDRKKYVYKKNI